MIDKQQEIELAIGNAEDLRSHIVFGNVYYDFRSVSATWTLYLGAGVGEARSALDCSSIWILSSRSVAHPPVGGGTGPKTKT